MSNIKEEMEFLKFHFCFHYQRCLINMKNTIEYKEHVKKISLLTERLSSQVLSIKQCKTTAPQLTGKLNHPAFTSFPSLFDINSISAL